jgi:hypothetical protein
MLSGWLGSTLFNRTRRLVTPITFKKKLCTFTAAQAAHRISIPSQLFSASSLFDGKVYRLRLWNLTIESQILDLKFEI